MVAGANTGGALSSAGMMPPGDTATAVVIIMSAWAHRDWINDIRWKRVWTLAIRPRAVYADA